jgi:hypothetical protein
MLIKTLTVLSEFITKFIASHSHLTCSVFHELDDLLTNAALDINVSQKFYHKLYKSGFSGAHKYCNH